MQWLLGPVDVEKRARPIAKPGGRLIRTVEVLLYVRTGCARDLHSPLGGVHVVHAGPRQQRSRHVERRQTLEQRCRVALIAEGGSHTSSLHVAPIGAWIAAVSSACLCISAGKRQVGH